MFKELFIHIGNHKTGSTAIQCFLTLNRLELQKQGILYPGTDESHYPITKELREMENPYLNRKTQVYQIFSEIKEKSGIYNKCILSTEGFCEDDKMLLPNLVKTLSYFKIDAKIKIIVFIRPQVSWFESSYQQTIKDLNTRSKFTFSEHLLSKYNHFYCDYYARVQRWAFHFGKENVIVIPFYRSQSKSKIFSDFFKAISFRVSTEFIFPSSDKYNSGLNTSNIEFLRWMNILGINNYMFKSVFDLFESKKTQQTIYYNYLNPNEEIQITQYFAESNRKVALEYLNLPNGILFKNNENTIRESENVFLQKNEFNPEMFKQQIELIKNQGEDLLEYFYIEILTLNPNNMVADRAKQLLLLLLENLLGNTTINSIKTKYPGCDAENFSFLSKTKGCITTLIINHANFMKTSMDFSKHCSDKIRIVKHKIILESVGNDPYFSIQKCIGNYDSETFIKIVLEPPAETTFQLFFQKRTKTEYTESASLRRKIHKGLNIICFIIDDPEFNGQIRIDPGNLDGVYTIHEIVVKSNARSYEELFYENKKLISNQNIE